MKLSFVAVVLALTISWEVVGAVPDQFASPAPISGDVSSTAGWLIVFLPQGQAGSIVAEVAYDGNASLVRRHENRIDVAAGPSPISGSSLSSPPQSMGEESRRPAAARYTTSGPAYLRIKASAISISAHALGTLVGLGANQCPSEHFDNLGQADPDFSRASDCSQFQGPALSARLGGTLAASSVDAQVVELHGFDLDCRTGDCIDGARTDSYSTSAGLVSTHKFNTISTELIRVDMLASGAHFMFGGMPLDANISGEVRLPNYRGSCERLCGEWNGETLVLTGAIRLAGMVMSPEPGRLSAAISGHATSARRDETPISTAIIPPAAAIAASGAATVGGLLLVKILLPLLVRPDPVKVLESPRRKALYDHIQAKPGPTFRELARVTGMHLGTTRHHLTVLKRAGLVDEKKHGSTLRFFENHGRFATGWEKAIVDRDPALHDVLEWLRARPPVFQKDILEHFAGLGWSRSTTQHRLGRLVAAGVVSIRLQGRYKQYSVGLATAPALAQRPALAVIAPTRI